MALIDSTSVRPGTSIIIDGCACIVKGIDISKSGKHGASKCRIEAIGIVDGKKRVLAVPGTERFETPMIEKRKAQVLSINKQESKANIMDLESFETFDAQIDLDVIEQIEENRNAEYWTIEGKKIIKRLL